MHETTETLPGLVTGLAERPREAHLDATALGKILCRHKKSVQRMWRRGDLPPPFRFGSKHVWLVGAILDHMAAKQASAIREAKRRDDHRPGG